jgi:hypothetical protein
MPSKTRPAGRSLRRWPRPGSAMASSATTADTEAALRALNHVKGHLELLTADLGDLMRALGKGPDHASALAAELLDDPEDPWRYTRPTRPLGG